MGTVISTICAALVLMTASQAQDATALERAGKHFRIVLHGADLPAELAARLADECLAAAETFWPILDKLLAVRVDKPLAIHVYRSEKEFDAVATKNPAPFRLEAFTTRELEGHVLLRPELRPEFLRELGVPREVIDDLRRIAAEQVITPLVPLHDEGGWLRGVAVMGAVEMASNPKHLSGVDACHDSRRSAFAVQDRGSAPWLFDRLVRTAPITERQYWDWLQGSHALVAQQLAAVDSSWARKLLGKQRELRGRANAYDRRKQAVESVLGEDWVKIETRFVKFKKTIQPVWFTAAPLWQVGPPRSVLAGTSSVLAEVLAIAPAPAGEYCIAGRAELGPGDAQSGFSVHFGRTEHSYVAVHIEPKLVAVAEWRAATKTWHRHAEGQVELSEGRPFDFRVEVTESEVRVSIDGLQLARWSHGSRETHGQWGMFASDRLIRFESLQCGSLAAAKK